MRFGGKWLAASVAMTLTAGLLAAAANIWAAPPAGAGTQWPPSCSSSDYSCDDTGYQGQSTWGFPGGHNCTNYVAWRLQRDGVPNPGPGTFVDPKSSTHEGDAGEWAQAARNHGILVNGTPTVGSVAWFAPNQGGFPVPGWQAGPTGHVSYVEKVKSPTDIVLAEDNCCSGPLDIREVWAGDSAWPGAFIHYGQKAPTPGPPPASNDPSGGPAIVHDGYTSVFTVNAADHTLEETYLPKNGQPWNTQSLSANFGTPPVAAGTTPAAVFHDGYTSVFTINAADNTLQETYLTAIGQPWHTQNLSASYGTPPVAAGTSPAPLVHTSASGVLNFTSVFTINAASDTLQETYLPAIGQPWHTQSLSANNGTPAVAIGTSPLPLYHTGYTSVYTINAADNTLQETYLPQNGQPWHTQNLSANYGTPPVAINTSPVAVVHPDPSGVIDFASVYTLNASDNTMQETYLAAVGQPWHTQAMPTPPAAAP